MGDLSTEPSMEEILSSIKRIIAEEGDTPPGRARRSPSRTPAPAPQDDEVLELSDPMPLDRPPEPLRDAAPAPEPPRVAEPEPRPVVEAAMAAPSADHVPEPIVSPQAAQATRGALDQLSRVLVKPEPGSDGTLEGMVRDMLRPMLRDWIDAHLPHMVEEMVAKEIARIAGGAG